MPDKILIFANPIAGRGKGKAIARRIADALERAGFVVETFFNRPVERTLNSLGEKTKLVIAIGGDGTIRGVVNLFYCDGPEGPPILPVPMGTANLLGRHLNLAWPRVNLEAAVLAAIRANQTVRLDAGRANGRLFLLMAGVGIDAQIVHLLDHMRRGPIDFASYLLPAAMTFASYNFPPVTVCVDDKTILRKTSAIVMIGNVKEYGTGFPILPDAVPDDGLLDICAMPCRDRRELIEILVLIAAGEHTKRDDVIFTRGKTATVKSENPVPVQIDGDSAGFTPLAIEVLPKHVRFLINQP